MGRVILPSKSMMETYPILTLLRTLMRNTSPERGGGRAWQERGRAEQRCWGAKKEFVTGLADIGGNGVGVG